MERLWGGAQEEGAMRACLSDINAAAQMLGSHITDEKGLEYLAVLNRGASRLLRILQHRELVRRLTEEEEDLLPRQGPVELVELFRRICGDGAVLLEQMGVKLTFRAEMDRLITLADEELLEHMLLTLISNGVKAVGEGGTVAVGLSRTERAAILTVGDRGEGMDGRALERLLETEPSLPDLRPEAGAGLGLPLAQRIAAAHGGLMMLDSAPGGGTRAVVSLPVREGDDSRLERPRLPDSGYSRALTELSDVLPAKLFLPERQGPWKR